MLPVLEAVTLLLFLKNMTEPKIRSYLTIRNSTISINGEKNYSDLEAKNTIDFLKSAYRHYGIKYGKFFKMDHLSKLGFLGSELLLSPLREQQEDGFKYNLEADESAVILYNNSSSLHTDNRYQSTVLEIPSPAVFVYTLPNILIGEICIRNGFRGESTFFIEENFDSSTTGRYVRLLFETTKIKQCLTGWVEMTMDGQYNAALYLISNEEGSIDFTPSNLQHIFQKDKL